jgi:thiamine monophosphate synthase
MKYFVLGAGALGFAVVAIAGYTAERLPDLVLRDAALACLVTAFVGRWFWSVLERAFADTVAVRRAIAEAAEAAEEAEAAKKKQAAATVAPAASAHTTLGQRNSSPAAQTSR